MINNGCLYVVKIEKISPQPYYYFINSDNAEKFLWEYYLNHSSDNEEIQRGNYYKLRTIGAITNYGYISEEYFEDFEEDK